MAKDLTRDYLKAGFSKRLGFGRKTALLMVDFVGAYFIKASPLYAGVEKTAATAKKVLAAARSAGVPVIYTRVAYEKGARGGGVFARKVGALKLLVEGSRHAAITESLAPRPDELVITKHYASAFFGTSLASTLTSIGADTVVICGLTTSGCVRASAVDAMQHGFAPVVVADAVGDRDQRPHESNLFDLAMKYADVIESGEAIKHFSKRART